MNEIKVNEAQPGYRNAHSKVTIKEWSTAFSYGPVDHLHQNLQPSSQNGQRYIGPTFFWEKLILANLEVDRSADRTEFGSTQELIISSNESNFRHFYSRFFPGHAVSINFSAIFKYMAGGPEMENEIDDTASRGAYHCDGT